MRAPTLAVVVILTAASAAPVLAQGAPSSNLNSINNSLAGQAQTNSTQQQQTSGANTQRMQNNRNQMSQPAPTGQTGPIVAPARR
jgi:hypothetical protein